MKQYLIKQFYRNKAYLFGLLFLFLVGLMSIYTGKKFLEKNEDIIIKSEHFQRESIEKNVKYNKDDLGLILYYIKFNFINNTPKLAALSIGMRDLNPSIHGVTIRNLEEQRYDSDFYNPANVATGNLDFSFVLVLIFPLIIIAFCYNILSEEEENGTWKLLSVQSGNLGKIIDYKLFIRFVSVSTIYFTLLLIATYWITIPFTVNYFLFIISGWLYIAFWFVLCRWIILFRKTSAQNALILLIVWIGINFIVPMSCNMLIQKIYPTQESLEAVMAQREGFHSKWDEPKQPTMNKFYKIYPQFKKYTIEENDSFTWTWYYAMQQMGDFEAANSSRNYIEKMNQRNKVTEYLGYFFPSIHTQLIETQFAETNLQNNLAYGKALQDFHEEKRLYFYPYIFSGQNADIIDWDKQVIKSFQDNQKINLVKVFLPYLLIIFLLLILSQNKYKKLC